jgi:hypothetical protein
MEKGTDDRTTLHVKRHSQSELARILGTAEKATKAIREGIARRKDMAKRKDVESPGGSDRKDEFFVIRNYRIAWRTPSGTAKRQT